MGECKNKPFIAITTSHSKGLIMRLFNQFGVWRAGGCSAPFFYGRKNERSADNIDGLVVGGGDDIGIDLVDGKPELTIKIDPERDRLELDMIETALKRNIPVLGICRGAQMINAVFGGTLHKDIYESYTDVPRLRTVMPRKTVTMEKDSKLSKVLQTSSLKINALHHQSVDKPGNGLQIAAHDSFGIVQAIEATERDFVVGVQWHPELLVFSPAHQNLFNHLVASCQKN